MWCKVPVVLTLHGLAEGLQAMPKVHQSSATKEARFELQLIDERDPSLPAKFSVRLWIFMPGIVMNLASITFSALLDLAMLSWMAKRNYVNRAR